MALNQMSLEANISATSISASTDSTNTTDSSTMMSEPSQMTCSQDIQDGIPANQSLLEILKIYQKLSNIWLPILKFNGGYREANYSQSGVRKFPDLNISDRERLSALIINKLGNIFNGLTGVFNEVEKENQPSDFGSLLYPIAISTTNLIWSGKRLDTTNKSSSKFYKNQPDSQNSANSNNDIWSANPKSSTLKPSSQAYYFQRLTRNIIKLDINKDEKDEQLSVNFFENISEVLSEEEMEKLVGVFTDFHESPDNLHLVYNFKGLVERVAIL